MLQHLTGGGWGLVIRRILEASTRTLPLVVVLFIPIIIGAHSLYEWTDPAVLEAQPIVKFKHAVFESAVLYYSCVLFSLGSG